MTGRLTAPLGLALPLKEVVPARAQMGSSLGFHIILACMGIAFPAIVMAAHYRGLRRQDEDALRLARRWAKVMAVLVAVGAVSGTVLSFDMGLLWPRLMGTYGAAIGIPFSFEGIFFLLEAIFTAIYLYGWDRLPPWAHFWSLVPVAVTGIGGALSVVAANSWMNDPAGFTVAHGRITHVDPVAVFFNGATYYEAPHMILAAYMVAGGLTATPYAVGLLRGRRDRYHRLGFLLPFTVAAVATPFQIGVGDTAARAVASQQPVKFASMEYVPFTTRGATEWLGGVWYHGHVVTGTGIGIPDADSLLVGFSPHTQVTGWSTVPPGLRPPMPTLIHLSFDLMVGIGFAMLLWGVWLAVCWWRRRDLPRGRPGTVFLAGGALSGVAAVAAMEAGWVVTEVGRQPWTVYHVLTTSQAATTAGGVPATLGATLVIYGALTVGTFGILWVMKRRWDQRAEPVAGGAP
ncbi:MAG TPA: cytochrome ubiquinol oxidase subunit I [Streptosporangiaceae bacterium]